LLTLPFLVSEHKQKQEYERHSYTSAYEKQIFVSEAKQQQLRQYGLSEYKEGETTFWFCV
jgi:hypothetical protein